MFDLSNISLGKESLEDGIYSLVVDEIKITESKNGNPMIVIDWVVAEGGCKGEKIKDFNMMNSEIGMAIFKGKLKALTGEEPSEFGEDSKHLYIGKELLAGIAIEQNGKYENPRFICCEQKNRREKIESNFPSKLQKFKDKAKSKLQNTLGSAKF